MPFPPPDEVPRCAKCGVSGTKPWGQLGHAQRQSYWVIKGDVLECKACNSKVGQRLGSRSAEQVKACWDQRAVCTSQRQAGGLVQEDCCALATVALCLRVQERVLLSIQKEERYPRQAKQPTLRTIDSGTQWDNTASFYDGLGYVWGRCLRLTEACSHDTLGLTEQRQNKAVRVVAGVSLCAGCSPGCPLCLLPPVTAARRRVSALDPRRSIGPLSGAGPSEVRIDPAQRLEQIQHELVGGPSMVVVEEDIEGEKESWGSE